MADDKRNTKRERKEEAKRRRLEEIKRRQRRARMRKIYTFGTVAVVIVGFVAIIMVAKQNSSKKDADINRLAAAAGCDKMQNPPIEGREHPSPPATVQYKTNPPTSGDHYSIAGVAPNPTGVHSTPIQDEFQVHNLEHGHIITQYKQGLDPALLTALTAEVNNDNQWMIIAPRPDMPFQLAFTAWGHLIGCNSPNAKAADLLKAFHDRFKNKAPEPNAPGAPLPSPT